MVSQLDYAYSTRSQRLGNLFPVRWEQISTSRGRCSQPAGIPFLDYNRLFYYQFHQKTALFLSYRKHRLK